MEAQKITMKGHELPKKPQKITMKGHELSKKPQKYTYTSVDPSWEIYIILKDAGLCVTFSAILVIKDFLFVIEKNYSHKMEYFYI